MRRPEPGLPARHWSLNPSRAWLNHLDPEETFVVPVGLYSHFEIDFEKGEILFLDEHRAPGVLAQWTTEESATAALSFRARSAVGPPSIEGAAVGATSILAVFLLFYFGPFLKYLAGQVCGLIPGYAKLSRSEILNHETREMIRQAVLAEPGITAPQVRRLTGIAWSTLGYHLGRLEKTKFITSLLDGRHKRFFPAGALSPLDQERASILKNERTRAVFESIQSNPGIIQRRLAALANVSSQGILFHLKRLERGGLIVRNRKGRNVEVRVAATTPDLVTR